MAQLTLYLLSFLAFSLICAALVWLKSRIGAKQRSQTPPQQLTSQTTTLRLPDGSRAQLTVTPLDEDTAGEQAIEVSADRTALLRVDEDGQLKVESAPTPGGWFTRSRARLASWPYSLAQTLFVAGLLLYTLTRLVGISDYPIFFFTDEAIQTNLASDFIRDNFHNYDDELFPTYFENVDKYSLSLTVYAQVIPLLLFGKSVLVTRATAALLTVLAAYWLSLILRDGFKLKYWWAGALLLAISPAWFLHSRTAFETCLLGTLYAGFLYYYLRYRQGELDKLYLALVLGALAFYSYNPGRVVITLTGLLLLLSDFRYHWRQRESNWKALLLLAVLALPFLRFSLAHPTAQQDQLRLLASYWMTPLPFADKLRTFLENYWLGLGPGYWFIHNDHDLVRHQMDAYPHLLSQTMVFAVLGLDAALRWLERRGAKPMILTVIVFLALGSVSIGLTADALINGPTWSHEYGLSGMQYGGRQLYGRVLEYLQDEPDTRFFISPNWTNGANVVARFFLPDPMPIELGSVDGYAREHRDDIQERTFVVIPEEYEMVVESGKFSDIDILEIIPYPDGAPGFYFLQMEYSKNIDDILAVELVERKKLVDDEAMIADEMAHVRHSQLDMGDVYQLFDGDPLTVARTDASNPFEVEIIFPSAHQISGITLVTGSADVEITVTLYSESGEIVRLNHTYRGSVDRPQVTLETDSPVLTQHVRIQVRDKNRQEPAHVHLWEITFEEE